MLDPACLPSAWRKYFRGFHIVLDDLKDEYPDTPDGHSTAATDILDGSNQLFINNLKCSLSYLDTSKAIDAGVSQELAILAKVPLLPSAPHT